ncbi:peroxide stress protein YaaA [Bradyrhizobium sp. TZ2]
MTGLVLFLHGQGGNKSSWQAVPDFVKKIMGPDVTAECGTYHATAFSPANLKISAGEIQTLIQTEYADRDPIYLVGHSLGGLVARELCRRLLVGGDDTLLARVKAVLTVASPLEGVSIGNRVFRWFPALNPKLAEMANPAKLYNDYRDAIRIAEKRNVPRPKLLHFALAADRVIAKHIADHFTDDDCDAGVLPGAHSGAFVGRNNAEYAAKVLVGAIRRVQIAPRPPTVSTVASSLPPQETRQQQQPDQLVLIACSRTKRDGGVAYGGRPLGWVPEIGLRQELLAKRRYIYSILRDGKLFDNFERGGDRRHQPGNADLVYGLDLGGSDETGNYMPASARYSGRLYKKIEPDAWVNYAAQSTARVLIMSGLYGLIEPSEEIQNYDVHLSDTHRDHQFDVKAQWLDLFTKTLSAYVQSAYTGRRKVKIFNFLCDHHYVNALRWHSLPRDRCSVFHFASDNMQDIHLLPPAGVLLDSLLKRPDLFDRFGRDERDAGDLYALTDFRSEPGLSDFRFGFQSRVGGPSNPTDVVG